MLTAQVFEKNHFLDAQNRRKPMSMSNRDRMFRKKLFFFLALGIGLAILAPVAVLAG